MAYTFLRYNQMRGDSKKEEFALVEEEVQEIDDLIDEVQIILNWTSPSKLLPVLLLGCPSYVFRTYCDSHKIILFSDEIKTFG